VHVRNGETRRGGSFFVFFFNPPEHGGTSETHARCRKRRFAGGVFVKHVDENKSYDGSTHEGNGFVPNLTVARIITIVRHVRVSLTDTSGATFARQYLHVAGRAQEHRARLLRTGEHRAGRGPLAVTGQARVVVQADVPPSGHFLSDNAATCGTHGFR